MAAAADGKKDANLHASRLIPKFKNAPNELFGAFFEFTKSAVGAGISLPRALPGRGLPDRCVDFE